MPGTNMEIRQKKEQTEYQLRMTEAVRQVSKEYNLPPLSVVHDTPIAARDLHDSINYLGILLKKANRIHSSLSSLPPQEMERTKPRYYKALSDVRDFSIHCLELSGELYERGLLNVNDPDVVRIARFFCDIQDSTPDITSAGKAMLRSVSIIDTNDPFETNRFRSEVVGYICSLATIPSGQVLLKTLFDLRYYDPKLEHTRRDHDRYLPSTIRIINPFIELDPNMISSAFTTYTGSDGQITKEAQPRVMHGVFRENSFVVPPILEINRSMQSMLDIAQSTNQSGKKLLHHFAEIDMGHEMIHAAHHSYGTGLFMDSSFIQLEERVTAGDVFGTLNPAFASETTRADSAVFDHADDSVKEAFLVSEQSLRRDFGTVPRHSYVQKLDIDGTDDALTEEERLVYLFTDELIQDIWDRSFVTYPDGGNVFQEFFQRIGVHTLSGNGKMIDQEINDFFEYLKNIQDQLIDFFLENVFLNMLKRQYGDSLTPQQHVRTLSAWQTMQQLIKSNKLIFFNTISRLLTIRVCEKISVKME